MELTPSKKKRPFAQISPTEETEETKRKKIATKYEQLLDDIAGMLEYNKLLSQDRESHQKTIEQLNKRIEELIKDFSQQTFDLFSQQQQQTSQLEKLRLDLTDAQQAQKQAEDAKQQAQEAQIQAESERQAAIERLEQTQKQQEATLTQIQQQTEKTKELQAGIVELQEIKTILDTIETQVEKAQVNYNKVFRETNYTTMLNDTRQDVLKLFFIHSIDYEAFKTALEQLLEVYKQQKLQELQRRMDEINQIIQQTSDMELITKSILEKQQESLRKQIQDFDQSLIQLQESINIQYETKIRWLDILQQIYDNKQIPIDQIENVKIEFKNVSKTLRLPVSDTMLAANFNMIYAAWWRYIILNKIFTDISTEDYLNAFKDEQIGRSMITEAVPQIIGYQADWLIGWLCTMLCGEEGVWRFLYWNQPLAR